MSETTVAFLCDICETRHGFERDAADCCSENE